MLKIISNHKIATGVIVIILAIAGYFGYKLLRGNTAETRYALAAVSKGTIIVSVSGSGQISASNQVDIKPKASGNVVYLSITNSQTVKAGTLLAQLDTIDIQKSIRDAEANLELAKLSLEKINEPADQLSILQAKNALSQAQKSKQKAESNLSKTYEDGFNSVSNAFLELPGIMAGLNDVLFSSSISVNSWNIDYYADAVKAYDDKAIQYRDDVYENHSLARAAYDKSFDGYKSANRSSETTVIESLINETYETTKKIAEAIKNANNLIQFYKDKMTERNLKPVALTETHLSTLNNYTSKTNNLLVALLSIEQSIQNDKDAIVDAEQNIVEKTASLAKLEAGPDDLEIKSQELTIKQRQDALSDAQEKLTDYFIRAPFDGTIVETSAEKGDSVSAGTTIATLITKQRLAEISLNEVDAAKIKIGQKATLTFDAFDGLSIVGQVAEIDTLGTISQGVVSYNVKITLDTDDERIKPGMSVSTAIITEAKQNALLIPNSAVKIQNGANYVEMPQDAEGTDGNELLASAANSAGVTLATPPKQQSIEIGLSNDSMTEITNGLKEGDVVVVRTIASSSETQSQQSQGSSFRMPVIGTGGSFR